jgi:hypothetical protein
MFGVPAGGGQGLGGTMEVLTLTIAYYDLGDFLLATSGDINLAVDIHRRPFRNLGAAGRSQPARLA